MCEQEPKINFFSYDLERVVSDLLKDIYAIFNL